MSLFKKKHISLKTIKIGYRKGERRSDLVPDLAGVYQIWQAKARAESRYITQRQKNNRVKGAFLLHRLLPRTGNVSTVAFVCFLTCGCKILDCKYCIKFLFKV